MAKFARTRALARRVTNKVASAPSRIRTVYRRATTAPVGASRKRRAVAAIARGGSAVAVAQAKIAPAAVGGYVIAAAERTQRNATEAKPALIKDPRNRLLAELALLALARTRTSGLVTAVIDGAAGGVGALYETYTKGGVAPGTIQAK